jgi:hypothetical protein
MDNKFVSAKLDIDKFPGYDSVYISCLTNVISKYKYLKDGKLLPIEKWRIDVEKVSTINCRDILIDQILK